MPNDGLDRRVVLLHAAARALANARRAIGLGLILLALTGCVTEKTIIVAAPSRTKPASASAVVKGTRVPYELWFDDTKWRQQEPPLNKEAASEFVGTDMYGQVFVERIPMPIESLQQAILSGAKRRGAKEVTPIRQERRFVNGTGMLYLQVSMTVDGVPLVYVFHVHSGPRGTIQVLAYTGKTLFDELRKDMEDLLDGLVVRE